MNSNLIEKLTYWILAIVIVVRISLILLPSLEIDITDYQAWAGRIVERGPTNFYSPDYFADYFPGYLYMLYFLGNLFNFLFPNISIFSLGFEHYLKLFTNFFDFGSAYFIYKIVSKYQKKFALLSAIFYLANPALAFNSSVWGQVDGILAFFLIYSAYNLLELNRPFYFSLFSAVSILVKPQALAIIPVTLIYLITNFNYRKYISLLLIPFFLIFFSLPFFPADPILGLFHLFQKSTNTYPYTTMYSYNFWALVGWWTPDANKFFGITFQVWGTILYFISLIIITVPLFIKKNFKNNSLIYFAAALSIFAFFLFLTRIHQRYLFPFFAFFLIISFIRNSLSLKLTYILLSFIHFINLWFVYYYYNYVFSNSTYASFAIYKYVNANYNLFTMLNLIAFAGLTIGYYKYCLRGKVDV